MKHHKKHIQEHYGRIAESGFSPCCSPAATPQNPSKDCCSTETSSIPNWYSGVDVDSVPSDAQLGLGCGNPLESARLQKGEVVLDLGSGAGFDCFLASRQVGSKGRVIGVDFTSKMISRAQSIATAHSITNVEFLLGELENLPVPDSSIDVVISNCVINLSSDKQKVFREVARVLKPGGRLAVEDIIACIELPQSIKEDEQLVSTCVGGAETIERLVAMMKSAGLVDVMILPKAGSIKPIAEWKPGMNVRDIVTSATVTAKKPGGTMTQGRAE